MSCQLMECTQYYRCIEHKEIKVDDFVKQRCFIYLKIIKNKKLCTSILSSKKSNFHQLGAIKQKLLWFSAKVWSLSRFTEINSYDFLQKVDHDEGWLKKNKQLWSSAKVASSTIGCTEAEKNNRFEKIYNIVYEIHRFERIKLNLSPEDINGSYPKY